MSAISVFALLLFGGPVEAPDTLVVCPPEFRRAMQPWVDYRTSQGHSIAFTEPTGNVVEMQRIVRRVAANAPLRYLVLVGDTNPLGSNPDHVPQVVPTAYVPAQVNVHFGSQETIATDNPFADLDDDGDADLSVGRIPVDSASQLATYIERVIAYEQRPAWLFDERNRPESYGSRRIQIVAGPGEFGAVADAVLEMTAKRFIRHGIPAAYETATIFANPNSDYCPDLTNLYESTMKSLNRGSLFWVYVGHGQSRYLHPIYCNEQWHHMFDVRDVEQLECRSHWPIAVLLCCYAGAFDFPEDCLAERMINAPGGPIAALSASRKSMPFAMSVMADAMLSEYFDEQPETLGDLYRQVKERAGKLPSEDTDNKRQWMESLAKLFSPTREMLREELSENLALFNLLGDPLLRLPYAGQIDMSVPPRFGRGNSVTVSGVAPHEGRLTVELVYRRDRMLPARTAGHVSNEDHQRQQRFEHANDKLCRYQIVDVPAGPFELDLYVPSYVKGSCHVRALLSDGQRFAIGSRDVYVTDSSDSVRR